MGKKQGEAQRVKGNVKPSSSAKAAEMLQQFASNSSIYGFGSDLAPIGIGTLLEDTFDSSIDSDFRMVLKKLYKKDIQTKSKALDELKGLIDAKSQEDCISILPYWSKSYTKLTVDSDRKIRELCQQTHEKLCIKVSKNIAPHLKTIMPYWLLAQADSFMSASRVAESSFKTMFNEAKQPEVVLFAKEEILSVLYEYLIVETTKTLSDIKLISEDEAQLKYETVLCMSLRGLGLFLKYYFSNPTSKLFKQSETNSEAVAPTASGSNFEKLEKIFGEQKFWKFSKDNSLKIRADFFHVVSSAIDQILLNSNLKTTDEAFLAFQKNLKLKIVPLIFYACDEDNQTCCYYVWESILKCLRSNDRLDKDIWSLLNVKKAFLPKLIALLRHHANGTANSQNIEIVFPSLCELIQKLDITFNNEERVEFYKDFFSRLSEAVFKESSVRTRFNLASNRIKMVCALLDCLSFVINEMLKDENKDYYESSSTILLDYVFKLYEKYLDEANSQEENEGFSFEIKFQKFIEETIEKEASSELLSQIKSKFWTELSEILNSKLRNQEVNHILILNNFSNLFKAYWNSKNKPKENLFKLIEILFNTFYDLFETNFNKNEHNSTQKYLICLNKLCMNFMDEKLLNLFLKKCSQNEVNLNDKLDLFNTKYIESLIAKLKTSKGSSETSYLLSGIVDLFLIMNLNLNSKKINISLIKKLDYYVFELIDESNQYQVEGLIERYLLNSKLNKLDSKLKNSLTEWIINSDKAKNLIVNKIFSPAKLFSPDQRDTKLNLNNLAVQLIENLIKCESTLNLSNQNESIQTIILAFMDMIVNYVKNVVGLNENNETNNKPKSVNLNELENYLNFSSSLLFECDNSVKLYVNKLIDLDRLWAILLNNLLLKSNLKLKQESMHKKKQKSVKIAKLDVDLNEFINKLTKKLLNERLDFEDIENISLNFKVLNEFISEYLKNLYKNQFILNDLLLNLMKQFKQILSLKNNEVLKKSWMLEFYTSVLFDIENKVSFKCIFTNLTSSPSLLTKIYLDNLSNYTYTQSYPKLISLDVNDLPKDENNSENKLIWLKQISYTLTLLNDCFETLGFSDYLMFRSNSVISNGEWVYLLLSSMILNKYKPLELSYLENKLNKSVQFELNKFIYDTSSFELILDYLNDERNQEAWIDFVKCLFENELDFKLRLNDLSLFLCNLIHSCLERYRSREVLLNSINLFAQNLIHHIGSLSEFNGLNLEDIKFYIYDVPFAKHSIIDNLSQINENIEHYYSLFSQIFDQHLNKLDKLLKSLKSLNQKFEMNEFMSSLSMFNSNLDIVTKYLKTYLGLLNERQEQTSGELKLFKVLNCSPSTQEFLKSKLSSYLAQIIELFIELKGSFTNKIDAILGSGIGGYGFYFNFDLNQIQNEMLKWEQMNFLDKMNKFLSLFFIDYKLQSGQSQQLSQYLKEKQWDFILCYSASAIQKLNKLDAKNENKLSMQILEISSFELVNLLIRCMQIKCRDNLTGNYPKSVYSDWNGFFSKEIYDPLLCLYVRLADKYTSQSGLNLVTQCAIKKLSNVVSLIPIERLIFNVLEAKFNVLDLDMGAVSLSSSPKKQVISLNDSLKTAINHLTPHLKHKLKSVQMGSFRILKTLMKSISKYYKIESSEDEREIESNLSIIESLPYEIRETLNELNGLFVDIKNTVEFEQSVLVFNPEDDENFEEEDGDEEEAEEDKETQIEDVTLDLNKSVSTKLAQIKHQNANNKLMSYLLINTLVLEMLSTDFLEFKVKLVNNLREIGLNDHLMHMLFRLMPSFKHSTLKLFASKVDISYLDDEFEVDSITVQEEALNEFYLDSKCINESFTNKNVEIFACKLYKYMLKCVPAMIRDWWNIQPKRIADQVDKYTTKYVSPVLIEEEIKHINRSANLVNETPGTIEPIMVEVKTETEISQGPAKKKIVVEDDEQSTIKIKGMVSTREIVSTYKMKELNMELIIQLPINHPLGVIQVSSVRRLGVSENEWRNWLLQLTTYLTHQNGSIIQSLQIWKKNVDKKFSGVEECTICYSVIHGTNYQLPKMKCRTCRKLFHSMCLYKWFESSSKSTCPLCRNLF